MLQEKRQISNRGDDKSKERVLQNESLEGSCRGDRPLHREQVWRARLGLVTEVSH